MLGLSMPLVFAFASTSRNVLPEATFFLLSGVNANQPDLCAFKNFRRSIEDI